MSPANHPSRVLLADDQPRIRSSVACALEATGNFVVCAEVGSADDAVAAAVAHHPEVCLLDINMPGGGIAAAGAITAKVRDTNVVMLTVSRQDDDLFDALRAGARGYLLKDLAPDRIGAELERVLRGEAVLPGTLVARLVEEFRDREDRRMTIGNGRAARLTGREWDVLELLRQRLTTEEIAARLFVSQTTVRTHVSSVLRKLQVADRDEAVRLLDRRHAGPPSASHGQAGHQEPPR